MKMSNNLKYKIKTATVTEKLIVINVAVFILFFLMKALAFLFGLPSSFLMEWFVFPKEPMEFLFKPWSIITYAFLHAGIWHILGNMLILYYSGVYFLTYFSPKRLLTFYFLGAIFGALVFMLSYNLFPAFAGTGKSYLLGASAAVMSVLVGIATRVPNMRIRFMFLGSLKFWWIAAFLLVLDVIQIPISNPGGHLAHLGGAAFGYFYASQLRKGYNPAWGFENLMGWLASVFSRKQYQRKSPLKTVHRKKKKQDSRAYSAEGISKREKQEKIDIILDKIGTSGYDSLSKQEKEFLFHSGKEN